MGLFDQVPGLSGYQQQVQLNQQQDANQITKLAQLLGVQESQLKLGMMQRQLATREAMGRALQDAYKQSQPTAQPDATYSPSVSQAFGLPANTPVPQAQGAKQPSAADIMIQAAIKEGDYDSYQEAQKLKLEEKKAAAKFATKPEVVMGPDGKPMLVQTADDGTVRPIQGGYGPAEKLHFADNGQQTGIGIDQYTGKVVAPGMQKLQSPDSKASNALGWFRANQEFGDNAKFTDAAVDNAAARYNIDGTLPPMGMGKMGGQARAKILNRAAELAAQSGVSPDDQRIAQIGNKANTAALSKLQQQQTMVGAFEKNFNRNADLALGLSDKAAIDGVPLVSKWLQAGKRSIAGDPDISAYDVALKATVNEYAKIISGSMGNTAMAEGEIKKVESLLSAAQTPAQVKAVISFMKQETDNRMKGFEEEKAQLKGSISGKNQVAAPVVAPTNPSIFQGGKPADTGVKFLGFE